MKKNYWIALLLLAFQFSNAQLEPVAYRGAFAPAPAAMWTDSWTNWNPQDEAYTDAATVVNVTANITANTTWAAGKTYKLNGTIYVTNNATLTIAPGVVVKGIYSNTGTALVITKGAKLNAIGTATAPIVFTSAKPAGSRAAGDWGGVIILGKGAFNQTGGLNNIEGLPANANTEYGGGKTPDLHDNSGIMKYCRIEFGGFVFSPNNEINGLTFGAVGDGTTIDNVQVSFSGDDSFEWFGGTVNCKHLVAYRGLDDDLDTDNGYAGTVQFALCIRDPQISDNPAISTSEGFESDSNPNDVDPDTSVTGATATKAIFSNCTMVGPSGRLTSSMTLASGYQHSILLRRRTELKVINSLLLDWTHNWAWLKDASTQVKAQNNLVVLNNNIFAGVSSADLLTEPNGVLPRHKSGTDAYYDNWMTLHNNTVQASSADVVTKLYNDNISDYSGSDYRPGTLASTGSSFAGDLITPYVTAISSSLTPVTTATLSLCQSDITTPLTASLTQGAVSLKWYKSTTATGAKTLLTAAPTPTTTAAGIQYYYVSQLYSDGRESDKASIIVTVVAKPTAVFAAIYNASAVAVTTFAAAQFVGTTTAFTFSTVALTDSSLSYKWSVPSGVNIVSGGTASDNSITVNFAGVTPDFVGTVGTLAVQAQNANGCLGVAKAITLTTALPAAPAAITITDKATATPATAITNYGKYAGTTNALTVTATASAAAAAYVWSLPAGVNLSGLGTATSTTTKDYYAYPFSGTGGVGNTSAGAHKWTVTNKVYTVDVNGTSTVITVSTANQIIQKGNTIDSFLPYGTVITSDKNAILVDFAGVTSSTTALYVGVQAKNGAGVSSTSNISNADVLANSTSIPGLFNTTYTETYVAPVNGCTSPNCGSSTWAATGVAAKTAKLLKLTATVPATVSKVTGTIANICKGSTQSYTITASPLANSYLVTGPLGSVLTSVSNPINTTETIRVRAEDNLTFSVKYPTVAPAIKTISIAAQNSFGYNVANKVLTLAFSTTCTTTSKEAADKVATSATEVYPNPVSSDFNIDVTASEAAVAQYAIYSFDGNLVVSPKAVQLNAGVNHISENVAALKRGFYIVRLVNSISNEVITKKLIKE